MENLQSDEDTGSAGEALPHESEEQRYLFRLCMVESSENHTTELSRLSFFVVDDVRKTILCVSQLYIPEFSSPLGVWVHSVSLLS
jgi:hypothetical protein